MCVCAQLCLPFCSPRDCNLPASSVHGIFQTRILERVAISSSRGSSQLRGQTCISYASCIGRRPLCHLGRDIQSGGSVQFSRSVVSDSVTPWTAACQVSLSITYSRSLSVMPSNHLILCRPLLLLPSIFPSIRVFSNESVLCIRWPKYWSFSFNISPSSDRTDFL